MPSSTAKNTKPSSKGSSTAKTAQGNNKASSSTPTKRKCPWCDTIVDINTPFCPECGEKLIKSAKRPKKKKRHPLLVASLVVLGILVIFGAFSGSDSKSAKSSSKKSSKSSEIPMGGKWVVDGQWELTINAATETAQRNEYSEKKPAAVYIVDYSYTNLGYYDSTWEEERLYFSMDGLGDSIIDNKGQMGYSYPGDITYYPQETPIGASCHAQACIGVDNPGDFKIKISKYDGNNKKQDVTMSVSVR